MMCCPDKRAANNGQFLREAYLDMWQATGDTPGRYSNVHQGIPEHNLRGRFQTDEQGAVKWKRGASTI